MRSASLRRKLEQEETSFRQLFAEVPLCQGFALLHDYHDSVLQVALAYGYLSAEKFSARFKQAFGRNPPHIAVPYSMSKLCRGVPSLAGFELSFPF